MSSGAESKIREAIDIALQHQAQGRLRAAGSIYRRVLSVDPENPDALHFLGVIAHKIGRPDLAMELLARSIAADPDRAGFRLNLGSLYLKRHQVEEAITCYRDAITLEPTSASAYAHLAAALARQGKLEEANDAFARATELKLQPQAIRPQLEPVAAPPPPVAASSEREASGAEPGLADTLQWSDAPAAEGPGQETAPPTPDMENTISGPLVSLPGRASEGALAGNSIGAPSPALPRSTGAGSQSGDQQLQELAEVSLDTEATRESKDSGADPSEQLRGVAPHEAIQTPLGGAVESELAFETYHELSEQSPEIAPGVETELPLEWPIESEPETEVASEFVEQSSEIATEPAEETLEQPPNEPQSAREGLPAGEWAEAVDDAIPLQAEHGPAPAANAQPVQLPGPVEAAPLPEPSAILDQPPIPLAPSVEPLPAIHVESVEQSAVEPATGVVLAGPIDFVILVEPDSASADETAASAPEVIPPSPIDFVIPVEPEVSRVTASGESIEHAARAALALQYAWALHFDPGHAVPLPIERTLDIDVEELRLERELYALPKEGTNEGPREGAHSEPDSIEMAGAIPGVDILSERHAFVGFAGSVPRAAASVPDKPVRNAGPAAIADVPAEAGEDEDIGGAVNDLWPDWHILPLPDPDPVEPARSAQAAIAGLEDTAVVVPEDSGQPKDSGPPVPVTALDDALIDLGSPGNPALPVLELDAGLNADGAADESAPPTVVILKEDGDEPFELDDDDPLAGSMEATDGAGESNEGQQAESPVATVPAVSAQLELNVEGVGDIQEVAIESSSSQVELQEPPAVDAAQVFDSAPAEGDALGIAPELEPVAAGLIDRPEPVDAAVEGPAEPLAAEQPAIAEWSDEAVAAPVTPEEPTATVPVGETVESDISSTFAPPVDVPAHTGDEIEAVPVRPGLLGEAHAQVLAGRYEPSVDGVVGVVVPAIDRSAETLPLPVTPGLRSIRGAASSAPAASRNRPPSAESLRRRAVSLIKFRRLDEAILLLKQAVSIRPKFAEAHRDLGGAMLRQGNLEGAITSLQRALQLRPGFAEAWGSLGDAYQLEGKINQAIRCYRRLLEIVPRAAKVHSNMLLSMNYDPHFSAEEVFHEHLLWAERHADRYFRDTQPHTNDRTPGRRLRIGYVSPDFRRHSVNYFAEPVLAGHYRRDFHVTCYSDVLRPDGVTRGLAELSDDFRDTHAMNDDQLAVQVRADNIDILVDLSGHTGNNRLGTFARKPAPVQVTYLGYPNTTGLSMMDYRITDALADPPGETERFHSEQLVRLPDTFLCYQPPQGSPDVGPLPCLKAGYVTFGCFNILAKITDEVLSLWARVLQELPNSRLVLKGRSNALSAENRRQHVRNIFVNNGISPDRLELLGKEPSYAQHLTHYRRLDIVLDPFPYNGTTTTCEALWMGLPVVTLAGDRHVSRVGVSILSNVGLPELIAQTPEQYVRIATGLADSPKNLSRLRSTLRDRMHRSPLTDSIRLTRALEAEYRNMWIHWCQSEHGSPAPRDTLTLTDG